MPSPNEDESKKDCISNGAVFVYRDTKTGELHYFSRRGTHKKNGRSLVFVKKARGETMSDHILNRTEKTYNDDKAGYPPNCNDGYVEKDGKCVPVEENNAKWMKKNKKCK